MLRLFAVALGAAAFALPLKASELVTDFMLDNGMQVVVV